MAKPKPITELPLPASMESESLVLGSLLNGSLEFSQASEVVSASDFHTETNRRIFSRMADLHEHGEAINYVTVHAGLDGKVDVGYLVDLKREGFLANLESYLRRIRETSVLRRTIAVCQVTIDECMKAGERPEEVLGKAERFIRDLTEKSSETKGLRSLSQIIDQYEGGINTMLRPKPLTVKVRSPWPALNHMVSSFEAGDLALIAARPGYGKSAAASQIAESIAAKGLGVALFSLEMSNERILQRMACTRAKVNSHLFRQGRVTEAERREVLKAYTALYDMPLYLDDSTNCSSASMHASLRKLRTRSSVALVIVDYLQLMRSVGRQENRVQEVAEISRGLKLLAKEFEVPLIALSQLSRAPEHERRRPVLADLRESGALEQDSDVVVFIHWPDTTKKTDKADKEPPKVNEVEFIVAKQRAGPLGKANLYFNAPLCRFEDRSAEEEEPHASQPPAA